MSGTPVDPLQTLQAALTVPANSKEQADLLAALRESLEAHPAPIRILVGTLIGIVANTGDSLLKRWVLDLLQFAICRSTLPLDQKTQLASQALDTLAQLLDDRTPAIVKVVIQCLTTVYPLLFRFLCSNRSNPAAWDTLSTCKTRILEFVWSPHANSGVKVSAVKFMQKVILVQTRGISDPRLQNKNDPNISFCPPDHPFISVPKLESEGQKLLENVITILFSSQNVDILSAVLNSWASLTKLRPAMTPVVIGTLKQWTPAALGGLSASSVKSVEKAIRILLIHISRHPNNAQYGAQINEIISQQAVRMERAVIEEKKRKAAQASGIDTKKRPLPDGEGVTDPKRVKLDSEPGPSSSSTNVLSTFDFTTLPATLITDLIVANIEAFTETTLINLVNEYRQRRGLPGPQAPEPPTSRLIPPSSVSQSNGPEEGRRSPPYQSVPDLQMPPPVVRVKDEEPVDPLQMDIDQDEIEYEPDRLNEELSGPLSITDASANLPASITTNLTLLDFKLPPPREFSDSERTSLVTDSIQRIWTGAEEIRASFVDAGVSPDTQIVSARGATDMTMLLLVRMITRVAKPPVEVDEDGDEQMKEKESENEDAIDAYYERQDQMRQALCEYIMSDFPSRIRLATTWMNEEWYNDRIRSAHDPTWRLNYETWLNQIVASYQTVLDGKDRMFSRFLLDLPSIPSDVLVLLRDLCVDPDSPDRMQVGFTTLRGFVIQRPAMRSDALNVLLDLTTHPEKKIRGAAINTVKLWVPNSQPMDAMVREFALQMLRKLQVSPKEVSKEPKKISVDGDSSEMQVDGGTRAETKGPEDDENMEDGQLPPEDLVQTPYLPERIELPAQKSHVLQHVELLFALSVKVPEFLEEIFAAYGQMDVTVQEAVQELITALIRSLGSNHGKLLTLMRNCPPGAETLALRVLTIFTENGRPGAQLVALVKALINERDLDARFLIPIIAEMDKPDIIRHLPRIVSILNGEPEPKNLVRSVFSSVVTTPPQTFGSVTSNLPRVRQSELLTPAELMVLLHEAEKEIGLKSAIEAIGICFSMTDVFRSEILAVVMQQIMDEPVLPVLFLRTVIQAVTTYKSLVGFVSTTLLSRLITKKIWTNPPLWEGFIRCAKAIAPASFGALLQLPKDQLRELVDKQPTLKSGLRDYVMKKATNKTRVSGFLDIFGEAEENTNSPNPSFLAPCPAHSIVPRYDSTGDSPGTVPHSTQGEGVPPRQGRVRRLLVAATLLQIVLFVFVKFIQETGNALLRMADHKAEQQSPSSSRRAVRADSKGDNAKSSSPLPSPGSWHVDRGRSRVRRPSNPFSEDSLRRRGYHSLLSSFGKIFHVEKRWKLVREMGSGAYGVVISAADDISGETVAIKLVTRVFEKIQLAKRALREITLLRHFAGHENITGLIDVDAISPDFNEIYLFMEPMEADLHQIIKSGQSLTNEHVQYFLYQILRGMKFIHSASVIHRDLKPGNLLVNADCELKICDFGLSRGFESRPDENPTHLTEYVATRWYRAPEIMLAFKRYNTAIDVWSIGCILAELLLGKPLFKGKDYVDQLNKILDVLGSPSESVIKKIGSDKAQAYVRSLPVKKTVAFTKILPSADPQALDLLTKMLSFDPDDRVSVVEALEHPWLSSYHDVADEPECAKTFEKWRQIEELETMEEYRAAIWKEIEEYRHEVRGVSDLSGAPIRRVSVSGGSGPRAKQHSLTREGIEPDVIIESPGEGTLGEGVEEEHDDALGPPPPTHRPATPSDPLISYARRSSILQQPSRQGSTYNSPLPSTQNLASSYTDGLVTSEPGPLPQGSVVFPTQGYVVPARSRTGSTVGGEMTRRLLRTLSTVSIHESLAAGEHAPMGKYIVEKPTTDAPPSEMPREFGIEEECEDGGGEKQKKEARFIID